MIFLFLMEVIKCYYNDNINTSNGSYHSISTYSMPGIILNTVHTFPYLPLPAHEVSSIFSLCG